MTSSSSARVPDPRPAGPVAQFDGLEGRRLFAMAGLTPLAPTTPSATLSATTVALSGATTTATAMPTASADGSSASAALASALAAALATPTFGHHGPSAGFGHGEGRHGWGGPRVAVIDYTALFNPTSAATDAATAGTTAAAAPTGVGVAAGVAAVRSAASGSPAGTVVSETVVPVRGTDALPAGQAASAAAGVLAEVSADAAPVAARPVTAPADDAVGIVAAPTARPLVVSFLPPVSVDGTGGANAAGSSLSGGLVRLLDARGNAAGGAVFRISVPAGVRARPAATDSDLGVDTADASATAATTAEQASLLPPVAELAAGRPLWQKLALSTAAALVVSANWIVRRRNRKIALAVRRG